MTPAAPLHLYWDTCIFVAYLNDQRLQYGTDIDDPSQAPQPEVDQVTGMSQHDCFKELARELGCDEDEAAFDEALKKLAESKPLPKHEPKKRKPRNS